MIFLSGIALSCIFCAKRALFPSVIFSKFGGGGAGIINPQIDQSDRHIYNYNDIYAKFTYTLFTLLFKYLKEELEPSS